MDGTWIIIYWSYFDDFIELESLDSGPLLVGIDEIFKCVLLVPKYVLSSTEATVQDLRLGKLNHDFVVSPYQTFPIIGDGMVGLVVGKTFFICNVEQKCIILGRRLILRWEGLMGESS